MDHQEKSAFAKLLPKLTPSTKKLRLPRDEDYKFFATPTQTIICQWEPSEGFWDFYSEVPKQKTLTREKALRIVARLMARKNPRAALVKAAASKRGRRARQKDDQTSQGHSPRQQVCQLDQRRPHSNSFGSERHTESETNPLGRAMAVAKHHVMRDVDALKRRLKQMERANLKLKEEAAREAAVQAASEVAQVEEAEQRKTSEAESLPRTAADRRSRWNQALGSEAAQTLATGEHKGAVNAADATPQHRLDRSLSSENLAVLMELNSDRAPRNMDVGFVGEHTAAVGCSRAPPCGPRHHHGEGEIVPRKSSTLSRSKLDAPSKDGVEALTATTESPTKERWQQQQQASARLATGGAQYERRKAAREAAAKAKRRLLQQAEKRMGNQSHQRAKSRPRTSSGLRHSSSFPILPRYRPLAERSSAADPSPKSARRRRRSTTRTGGSGSQPIGNNNPDDSNSAVEEGPDCGGNYCHELGSRPEQPDSEAKSVAQLDRPSSPTQLPNPRSRRRTLSISSSRVASRPATSCGTPQSLAYHKGSATFTRCERPDTFVSPSSFFSKGVYSRVSIHALSTLQDAICPSTHIESTSGRPSTAASRLTRRSTGGPEGPRMTSAEGTHVGLPTRSRYGVRVTKKSSFRKKLPVAADIRSRRGLRTVASAPVLVDHNLGH
eukprot:INCI5640.1.p1 GENE.INCI5640.1~~INCI5640.1.p1  ORF type:complete len:721 (-),score=111.59 INCI5640.1:211-2211(-)